MAQLLTAPFTQLPVAFDPQPLLHEVEHLHKSSWVEHRLQNLYTVPLVESTGNNVKWCSAIDALPSLRALLHTWDAPIGESRVSILEPGASIESHVDVDYYWKHRLRVHIVLQSNPGALFGCGEHVLSLPAGQLWVSNNWAPHWISNTGKSNRIHIVIDTVGSHTLWKWIDQGWHSTSTRHRPQTKELSQISLTGANRELVLERSSRKVIRSPAELQEIVDDCLNDMRHTASPVDIALCRTQFRRLVLTWRSIYQQYIDAHDAYPLYRRVLTTIFNDLPNPTFWNGIDLHTTLKIQVGQSLLIQPTVKYPLTDKAQTTQG